MHIITRKRLNDFALKHPDTRSALQNWYRRMKAGEFHSFGELRQVFATADQVGKLTVFNIVGILIEKYEDEHVPEITAI